MKATINGIEYETFEGGKNAKELGIDTSRKFIVMDSNGWFIKGEILTFEHDDVNPYPLFTNGISEWCVPWSRLAYYDEPTAELHNKPQDETRIYEDTFTDSIPPTAPRTIADVCEGDLVRDTGGYVNRVLGVCGQAVFLSLCWRDGQNEAVEYGGTYSIKELISGRFILYTPTTPEPIKSPCMCKCEKHG